ncbi:hypothetical protein PIROE2DRAFT_15971 [Piromyces sp. E2]|nr:hypothetical protein PIROE2DRAFT_15971 [Piromyces sp. E2]|eukprot:OUM58684.1 hypothetical protein PIROE2DRAFT_15971 [Piromyces sp. E2]
MLNSKIESDESRIINGSHSLRLNVIIDYLIEKDILVNGEVKSKEEIEEENRKKNNNKNSKKKNKNGKNSKNNKSGKKTPEKRRKTEKNEDIDTNYYFSYNIAGKIDGETDIIQYSSSSFSTFHDIEVNIV